MKIAYHKYVYINSFSFIKRFFLDPFTYGIITFIPLLSIPATVLSISGLTISLFLSTIAIVFSNYSIIYYLSPLFLLMIFKAQLYKIKFSDIVMKTRWLLIVSIIYAFIQIIFDFLPHEKMWIYSNLSIVKSPNVFVPGKSIRPFSIFASTPEFSLFCCIYLIEFVQKRNYAWTLISVVGLVIAGSRGIILSFILAYIIVYIFNINKTKKIIFYSLLVGIITYTLLIISAPLLYSVSEKYSTSRLLLYGSFYARFEMVIEATQDFNLWNLIYPNAITKLSDGIITFDNLFLTLIFNFGIFGFFIFWKYFDFVIEQKSLFFIAMFIFYGFFADIIYSFYLMYIFSIGIYSKKHL
jgi:hypothetical protein